jgi:hypothetical protein
MNLEVVTVVNDEPVAQAVVPAEFASVTLPQALIAAGKLLNKRRELGRPVTGAGVYLVVRVHE